jgi:hypothetical protein
MSTTTNGPFTPVVRRMIPSGSVNLGVSAPGVVHPSTHSEKTAPIVGGGLAGVAGGVGDAIGDAGVTGADDEAAALAGGDSLASQATSATPSAARTNANHQNLCN